ncbi:putative signaling protein [Hydrogenovibrio crunogenus]|uniref:cyclic-guanylate-specific phosphodiesterase n=1 Tax=Hydrogenovibrio crunogenus TaxID=39765 RepID=A0A4P7NZH8_9GAMM|nr:EAL domain-containing protein [Hydrogenovibrio crunogenus]QBZ83177.1 putative signaling protein [Hydrogenovibrio crunogenus]
MTQKKSKLKHYLKSYRIWLMFLLLFLMVPLFAITVIANHGPKMQQQTFNNLLGIAELKSYQIANWLKEQDKVTKVVSSNRLLLLYTKNILLNKQVLDQKKNISELFAALQEFYHYESISLIKPDASLLLNVGQAHDLSNPEILKLIHKSIQTKSIVKSDMTFESGTTAHLDIVVPLFEPSAPQNRVMAVVLLHLDPNHFIFPYLKRWPTSSQSSETLLVLQKGKRVQFLSPLRHAVNDNQGGIVERSMNEDTLPAVVALKNREPGVVEGIDYRGARVLAAYYPVKNTDWMIISKVDMEESTKSLNDLVFWIVLVSFFALFLIGIAFLIVLKKQRDLQALERYAEKTEAEKVLQKFYELPFIGMAILDAKHDKWVRFNHRLPKILRYSAQDLASKTFREIIHPKDLAEVSTQLEKIESGKSEGFTTEVNLLAAGGSIVFGTINVKCVRDAHDVVQYYLMTVQDVTELKHLAELNIEHQNQLTALVHTIPDLVWLKDTEGKYLSCNPSFEKFFGAKEADIIGNTDYDFVDKELADFFRENDCNAMAANESVENEEWLTFKENGYRGLFSTIKTPMKNEQGQVIGVLGVARDISKRKQDEARLERLTKLYSAMNHTNEAIIRSSNQITLFSKVCEIAVREGGMKMAWIGKIDKESNLVYPVAHFGNNSEYLEGLEISIDQKAEIGQGPTALAIRQDEPYWCQDFQTDPHTQPWHERAKQFGWQSSASLPLHQNSKVVGTLNLYSDTKEAFDEPIQNLLLEMAVDISFALNDFFHAKERKEIEASRQEAYDRLQKLADRLPGVIYQFRLMPDGTSFFPFASDALYDIYRVRPEDVMESADKVFEVIHPEDIDAVQQSIQESAERLAPWYQEYRVCFENDDVRWLSGNAMPEKQEDGSILWHGFITDISQHKKTEAQVELASKVFEQSREGIMITDSNQKILMVNEAFSEISGYSVEETLGKTPKILASGRHSKEFYQKIWKSIKEKGHWQGEIWNRRKNGEIFPEWLSISCGLDTSGNVTEYVGIFNDISKVKESEEKIKHLAHYDPLTGLVNRELLMDRLHHSISTAERNNTPLALLFIDLDHFKNVNDTLGHQVGDQLLIEVGQRILKILRDEDTIARQGGDEFIVVLPDTGENGAVHVAEKILETISDELNLKPYKLYITPSIGIAVYPQDGVDADSLLKNADTAMYEAKNDGRNVYRFFTMEMQAHSSRLMQIESALRMALFNQQFELYYQPQVCAQSGNIVGVEALIRWNHPEMGEISPQEFIPVAEQSGQILAVGWWVLRTAIRQIKIWSEHNKPCFRVAVNLSAVQFRYEDLPKQVMKILTEEGVSPEFLELELTESVAMANPEAAIDMMDKLVGQGIKMSIDDFGTGYSSLSYLKRFKASKLKIDQSFIRDLAVDSDDRSIVEAIISLSKALGLKTIAEGVETQAQLDFLKERQCDEIQGFYYSKALTAEAFDEFYEKQSQK